MKKLNLKKKFIKIFSVISIINLNISKSSVALVKEQNGDEGKSFFKDVIKIKEKDTKSKSRMGETHEDSSKSEISSSKMSETRKESSKNEIESNNNSYNEKQAEQLKNYNSKNSKKSKKNQETGVALENNSDEQIKSYETYDTKDGKLETSKQEKKKRFLTAGATGLVAAGLGVGGTYYAMNKSKQAALKAQEEQLKGKKISKEEITVSPAPKTENIIAEEMI